MACGNIPKHISIPYPLLLLKPRVSLVLKPRVLLVLQPHGQFAYANFWRQ